jgi:hypothetical protein
MEKKTLHAVRKAVTFESRRKVHFDFQTYITISVTKKNPSGQFEKNGYRKGPRDYFGQEVKLQISEIIIQKLALNKVALFIVNEDRVC